MAHTLTLATNIAREPERFAPQGGERGKELESGWWDAVVHSLVEDLPGESRIEQVAKEIVHGEDVDAVASGWEALEEAYTPRVASGIPNPRDFNVRPGAPGRPAVFGRAGQPAGPALKRTGSLGRQQGTQSSVPTKKPSLGKKSDKDVRSKTLSRIRSSMARESVMTMDVDESVGMIDPLSHAAREQQRKEEAERKLEREQQKKQQREAALKEKIEKEEERKREREAEAEKRRIAREKKQQEDEAKRVLAEKRQRRAVALSSSDEDEAAVFKSSEEDEKAKEIRRGPTRKRLIEEPDDNEDDTKKIRVEESVSKSHQNQSRPPQPEGAREVASEPGIVEVPYHLSLTLGQETNVLTREDLKRVRIFLEGDKSTLFNEEQPKIEVVLHQETKPPTKEGFRHAIDTLYFEMNSNGGWRKIRRKRHIR